jgi:hypothetical protein
MNEAKRLNGLNDLNEFIYVERLERSNAVERFERFERLISSALFKDVGSLTQEFKNPTSTKNLRRRRGGKKYG